MKIVPLENIPVVEYDTPKDNLMLLYATAKKMESICISKNGMGLAASQVGLPWKFFVYWSNYPETPKKFEYLLDCEYEPAGDKFLSIEGCLSLGSKRFQLERYESVVVSGKKLIPSDKAPEIQIFESKFNGILSVVMQHEIDHNHGRSKMIDVLGKRIYLS
jgi:peptide deformylase